ncbi:tripartite tricarboxylate transporter substrate binding protein [Ramlibacter sp.]|uniref:tripartite tricarboxylate transporter substrate binding protein n=1 Tax=Ramlibacter sp. TaxID=1917967 RepID=UPI002D24EB91|nr:tripartite tricarboxylate transporter substrate binding protein [Ramlibacter sp.]HYD76278.1 tripartite tricarboxylate transporter substrate binding protein [Ramlibacter sp.]
MNRRSFASIATALIATAAAMPALAFPDRPIEAVVPWPAGQELDILARAIVPVMSRQLGVPMAVINRPGGAGVVGTSEASRAKPDGYTILFNSVGPMLTQPLAGNAPYKVTDFEPIGLFNASSFVLIVRADAPYKTMQELEAHAKTASKPLVLGHFGPAAVPTQVVYRMGGQKKWSFRGVTFSPAGPAQLKSGDADLVTAPYNTARSAIAAGDARALVTFNPARLPELPSVPTLREAGYDFDVLVWQGVFVPKGTPADVKAKIDAAVQAALKDPSVVELARKINTPLFWKDAAATTAQIKADEAGLSPVMAELGLIRK